MSILLPPKNFFDEPPWLPAPVRPSLPIDQIHLWRVRMEGPRWMPDEDCPVSRERSRKLKGALIRREVIARYTGGPNTQVIPGPCSGLSVALSQSDHLALIAVSRNVRGIGLDMERICHDIPFEEMAGGFLDIRSQWDLRITWSPIEKAWKFFQFWTTSEARAKALPPSQSSRPCEVRGFSPEPDFIAALALQGGPAADIQFWDWQC